MRLPGFTALGLLGLLQSAIADNDMAALSPPVAPDAPANLGQGVVSLPDRYEFCASLSRDRRRLYIGIEHGEWQSIEAYDWSAEGWTGRQHIVGSPEFNAHDPYLSADETRLYFITRAKGSADIAYLPRGADGVWAEPVVMGEAVNSPSNDYYTSITTAGDLYFSSDRPAGSENYDIFVAKAGADAPPERLPKSVNSRWYEGDPYIDPAGRYLIFASSRPEGRGRGDLYLSIAQQDGGWSEPIAFDERINTPGHELCPLVSLDGSAFLFTSNEDIRWVSSAIIDEMIAQHAP
ncbi:MAG: hypothetical protein AAFR88_02695 [Pseudomonadota bacterium]